MRIIVLGGAGLEGTGIAKDLVNSGVSEVVLADYNLEGAQKIAAELTAKDTKVTAQFVDANDHAGMVNTIKGFDAVANAIGPFYIYGTKVVKAAIEAKVPYVDIDDDYDSTEACLAFDEAAKKAGLPVIIGLGASPGMTSVFASYAAGKLDKVDAIHISWTLSALGAGGPAVVLHCLHALADQVPVYIDGKWVEVSPAKEPGKLIVFPEPFGPIEVPHYGHSETITLPRFIKGVKTVTVRGSLYPPIVQKTCNQIAELGLLSREPIEIGESSVAPRDVIVACFENILANPAIQSELEKVAKILPTSGHGALHVEVQGEREGRYVKYTYIVVDDVSPITDWPASIGAQMLARGEIKQTGVLAPEQCIKPDILFSEMKKRGVEIIEIEEVREKYKALSFCKENVILVI